jgi:hypothetical protein
MVNVPRDVPGSLVVTVMREVAPFAPGTALCGEKLQEALLGKPAQERAAEPGKAPPNGAMVMV